MPAKSLAFVEEAAPGADAAGAAGLLRRLRQAWRALGAGAARPPAADAGFVVVREAMLAQLAACQGLEASLLRPRIRGSRDLASLWHLRGALMQALAAHGGEASARRSLEALDALFAQTWPAAPVSRPVPLR